MQFGLPIIICFILAVSAAASGWPGLRDQNLPPRSGVSTLECEKLPGGWMPQRDFTGANIPASDAVRPQNEVHLAVNPWNPDHIVGGCNDYRNGETTAGWYTTFDGGLHWENGLLPGLDDFDAAGNPTLAMDRNGRIWYAGIHFNRDNDNGGLFLFRSDDGGLEWENLGYIIVHPDEGFPPFEDKPMLRIDQTGGRFDGSLYISWTRFGTGQIYFSRSFDGGRNWSEPMMLYNGRGQGSIPVITPEGELYVFWIDYSENRIIGRKSINGGESFSDIIVASDAQRLPLYLRNGDVRVNSVPSAVCDISPGGHRGRIYIAWADLRNNDPDILMVHSDDGREWSEPRRLNDDQFQNGRHQFFPWLSVDDDTGVLSAVWYDRRNDAQNILLDVYGLHWSGDGDLPANERLTENSFDPRQGAFGGRFIGDQIGVISASGMAVAGWSDSRQGEQDIYTAQFLPDRFPFERLTGGREHNFVIESVVIQDEAADVEDAALVYDVRDNLIGGGYCEDDGSCEFTVQRDWADHQWNFYTFRIWDASEGRMTTAGWMPSGGSRLLRDEGQTTIRLVTPLTSQQFTLSQGWHFISSRVFPWTIDTWRLFYAYRESLGILRNVQGRFITYQWSFDNIGPFNPAAGYQVNVLSDQLTLDFEGYPLPRDWPLQLNTGWNLVAYLPDYGLRNPFNAFPDINDFIILVKDEQGHFYLPEWQFSNLRFQPNQAYQFKVSQDCILVWPPSEDNEVREAESAGQAPDHYVLTRNSPASMSMLVTSIINPPGEAERRGEVGLFTETGRLCGSAALHGDGPWGLSVWSMDTLAGDGFGAREGEPLSFRWWESSTGTEYALKPYYRDGVGIFAADGFAVVALTVSDRLPAPPADYSVSISPNPLNARGTLEFNLPQAARLEAGLYDVQGRSCLKIHAGLLAAGLHRLEFDCESLNSGLYILGLIIEGQAINQRVVVLR